MTVDDDADRPEETDGAAPPEVIPQSGSRVRRGLVLTAFMLAMVVFGAAIGVLVRDAAGQARLPGEGSVDVGFAQDMQVHHLQAITLAGIERDRTSDPALKTLAFDIESTQQEQVGEMAGWLTLWAQPGLPTGGTYMAWMAGSAHEHGGSAMSAGGVRQMPGMASSAQVARLRTLSGRELDVSFLQLTVRHHQGALAMARYAADHASTGSVRNLGQKIVDGQQNEIRLMTAMLAERGATPLPPPS